MWSWFTPIIIVALLSPLIFQYIRSVHTAWQFFTKRTDFLSSGFKHRTRRAFSFKVLRHTVTAVKGEQYRKAFYDDRHLDASEGYNELKGGAPLLREIGVKTSVHEQTPAFVKRLAILTHKDRMIHIIPSLFEDIQSFMAEWENVGTIEPFQNIFDLVYQMTIHLATCEELAADKDVVTRLKTHHLSLETNATPISLLLPWFPSSSIKLRKRSTTVLYQTLYNYVEKHRQAAAPSLDTIDFCIAENMTTDNIVQFSLRIMHTGTINTGINPSWALLYISFYEEWKKKVQQEIFSLMKKHTSISSSEPLHKRLGIIPVSAWEDETPILEAVLQETLRLSMGFTMLRYNKQGRRKVADQDIAPGAFVAYSLTDIHLNPDIYLNPTTFDPARYGPDRQEDKKEVYAFAAWGAGRHPCPGMKLAKLEMKMIIAFFIAGYEFNAVDSSGRPLEQLPKPNYNDIFLTRPIGEPCFLKLRRVEN